MHWFFTPICSVPSVFLFFFVIFFHSLIPFLFLFHPLLFPYFISFYLLLLSAISSPLLCSLSSSLFSLLFIALSPLLIISPPFFFTLSSSSLLLPFFTQDRLAVFVGEAALEETQKFIPCIDVLVALLTFTPSSLGGRCDPSLEPSIYHPGCTLRLQAVQSLLILFQLQSTYFVCSFSLFISFSRSLLFSLISFCSTRSVYILPFLVSFFLSSFSLIIVCIIINIIYIMPHTHTHTHTIYILYIYIYIYTHTHTYIYIYNI